MVAFVGGIADSFVAGDVMWIDTNQFEASGDAEIGQSVKCDCPADRWRES